MKKGFTLIELMIVVAIIAIIAAIAIPNLLQSRIQANEANAVTAMKAYGAAQNIFIKANYSEKLDGTRKMWYCTDFNALYSLEVSADDGSGGTEARNVALIARVFAYATTTTDGYQGYYFTPGDVSKYEYELYSNPCLYGKSGVNSFYIDTTGSVSGKDSGGTAILTGNPDSSWFTP